MKLEGTANSGSKHVVGHTVVTAPPSESHLWRNRKYANEKEGEFKTCDEVNRCYAIVQGPASSPTS